jgi:predicted nucleic acid-binding protein
MRFEQGMLAFADVDQTAVQWIASFLNRYRSLGAQLADATLAYLAEREGIYAIFTLNRRDFSVYRVGRNRSFRLLPEP